MPINPGKPVRTAGGNVARATIQIAGVMLIFTCVFPAALHADAVVGTGAPESCTEAAFHLALASGGKITFNCGAAPVAITMTTSPDLTKDTSIDGGNLITLSGGGTVQVLRMTLGSLTIANLIISDGSDRFGGSGVWNGSSAPLVVTNCTFSGNNVTGNYWGFAGGAILSLSPVTVTGSTFINNNGGAIVGGQLTVLNSTFSNNHGDFVNNPGAILNREGALIVDNCWFDANDGGAVINEAAYPSSSVIVANSVFSNNSATPGNSGALSDFGSMGPGIFGTLTVVNCTFSGNTGRAIDVLSELTVINSTVANNDGGVGAYGEPPATLINTIVANSRGRTNCFGPIIDGGHNLDSDGTCGVGQATDPLLDPVGLADHGGPTETIALLPDSPAIDAGDESVCARPPVNSRDQRGFARPGQDATNCSIGAYEYNAIVANTPTPTPSGTATLTLTPTETPTATPTPGPCGFVCMGYDQTCTVAVGGVLMPGWCYVQTAHGCECGPEGPPPSPTPTSPVPCVGDCNRNRHVTVDEILSMVSIALGNGPVVNCPSGDVDGDGTIDVSEILAAVNATLRGCESSSRAE